MPRMLAGLVALSALGLAAGAAHAAEAAPAAAPARAHYSTVETPLGDMLDDPAAKAVLQKHIPQLIASESIEMARGMSLKQLQGYAGDQLSDATLAAIDADLAKLAGH